MKCRKLLKNVIYEEIDKNKEFSKQCIIKRRHWYHSSNLNNNFNYGIFKNIHASKQKQYVQEILESNELNIDNEDDAIRLAYESQQKKPNRKKKVQ